MKRLFILVLVALAFPAKSINPNINSLPQNRKVIAIPEDRFLRIPPPDAFLMKSAAENKCEIEVRYHDFPEEAEVAFEYAVQIWESLLVSSEVIYMDAYWDEIPSEDNYEVLGAAGASDYFVGKDGFPHHNVFYPAPLAEKLFGGNINSGTNSDMFAFFSSETDWYYGTDGETPAGLYDLVTVVLHELCHGLGFIGSLDVEDETGYWGYGSYNPFSFDRFVYNGEEQLLIDWEIFPNPSVELYAQLTSNNLFFDGPIVRYNLNDKVELYVPSGFEPGSSIDHVSTKYYDSENSLMTPGIARASSIHDPGLIVMSIMEDMGWSNVYLNHVPLKNSEEIANRTIAVDIVPDFETEIVDPIVVYSFNGSTYDTLECKSTGGTSYVADLPITESVDIDYFVQVKDKYGRVFYAPNTAPETGYAVTIGRDTVAPVITHTSNSRFYIEEENLLILATVEDKFDVDTVWVNYMVNNDEKNPLGMRLLEDHQYNLVIDFSKLNLNVNDTIKYRISAVDQSVAKNTSISPDGGYYELVVSNLPEFIDIATYNFDAGANEFILNGFEFSVAEGFSNTALNSKHPYENGGQNTWIDYIAQLKFPIRLDDFDHYIEFDEIALIEPGEAGTAFGSDDFYDYVIVEGSSDDGETWIPFEDGWDCTLHPEWENAYNQSLYFNNTDVLEAQDLYRSHKINLAAPDEFNPGDLVLLRFRLNSDPFAVGWGWSIDNLQIQSVGLDNKQMASQSIQIFPNPVTDRKLNIKGADQTIDKALIYDRMGNLIVTFTDLQDAVTLELPETMGSGLYFVIIQNDKGYYSNKFLLQ